MVAAPKLFAFDNLFTADDTQLDVCSSALSEVIPAVLEGTDGCLLTLGYPGVGEYLSKLMKFPSETDDFLSTRSIPDDVRLGESGH